MANPSKTRTAFTLVEVLVVVSILAVLAALIIPQLRIINKERGIREAARVTSSAFAQASQRALVDGTAGVLLRRNHNYDTPTTSDNSTTPYSHVVDSLSLLRAVPAFQGDQLSDKAEPGGGTEVLIPYPIEQESLQIIKPGDEISFEGNSTRYKIEAVTPTSGPPFTQLSLTLQLTGTRAYLPNPNLFLANARRKYTIYRLPRPLRSSETVLPEGFAVDLRFSGFTMLDSGFEKLPSTTIRNALATQVFEPQPRFSATIDLIASDIAILFNNDGGIDRMVMLGDDGTGNSVVLQRLCVDNLRLLVTELSPDDDPNIDPTVVDDPTRNPLNSPDNLWVSVNRTSGSVSVGYNVVAASPLSLSEMDALYFGTATDRAVFNAAVSSARGDAEISVAIQ